LETPKAQETKANTDKWQTSSHKASAAKETVTRVQRQPTGWKKRFTNSISDKGFTSKT
jgi:hypothetical protein